MCFTMCDLKKTQFIDVFLTLTPLRMVFWALRKSKTLKKTLFSDVDLSQTLCFTMSDLKKHQKDYVFLTLTPLTMVFWAKSLPKASPDPPKVSQGIPQLPQASPKPSQRFPQKNIKKHCFFEGFQIYPHVVWRGAASRKVGTDPVYRARAKMTVVTNSLK